MQKNANVKEAFFSKAGRSSTSSAYHYDGERKLLYYKYTNLIARWCDDTCVIFSPYLMGKVTRLPENTFIDHKEDMKFLGLKNV